MGFRLGFRPFKRLWLSWSPGRRRAAGGGIGCGTLLLCACASAICIGILAPSTSTPVPTNIGATFASAPSLAPTNTPIPIILPTDTSAPIILPTDTIAPVANCDPAYPDVCIPSFPPDLDCGQIIFRNFRVLPPDPHKFDGNNQNGIGCEN